MDYDWSENSRDIVWILCFSTLENLVITESWGKLLLRIPQGILSRPRSQFRKSLHCEILAKGHHNCATLHANGDSPHIY